MADEADIANDYMEALLPRLITGSKKSVPTATGNCHYCGSVVADSLVYCDTECRGEHEYVQGVRARQGAA